MSNDYQLINPLMHNIPKWSNTFTEEALNGKLQFLCSDVSPLDILNHEIKQ